MCRQRMCPSAHACSCVLLGAIYYSHDNLSTLTGQCVHLCHLLQRSGVPLQCCLHGARVHAPLVMTTRRFGTRRRADYVIHICCFALHFRAAYSDLHVARVDVFCSGWVAPEKRVRRGGRGRRGATGARVPPSSGRQINFLCVTYRH
jgi:hypothetical protein